MRSARAVLARASSVAIALAITTAPTVIADELGRMAQRETTRREQDAGVGVPTFLQISNIRLQDPPPSTPQPSALLTFNLTNNGLLSATDIKLRIEIHERDSDKADAAHRDLIRPFELLGRATIEPGFTVEYALVFRNVTFDCRCEASVTVVSASAVPAGREPALPNPAKRSLTPLALSLGVTEQGS